MPRWFIIWVGTANKYVLIGSCILLFLASVILFPAFIAIVICYKLYESEMNPIAKYSIMVVVCIVALFLQMFWLDKLKKQYYPNLGSFGF